LRRLSRGRRAGGRGTGQPSSRSLSPSAEKLSLERVRSPRKSAERDDGHDDDDDGHGEGDDDRSAFPLMIFGEEEASGKAKRQLPAWLDA